MKSNSRLMFSCVLLLAKPGVGLADDAADGRRAHQAVVALRDEVFNHCHIKLDVTIQADLNGAVQGRTTGKYVFARSGESFFADIDVTETATPEGGRPARPIRINQQHFMSAGRRYIDLTYDPKPGGATVHSVGIDPRNTYDDSLNTLTAYVGLRKILAEFGPTGKSIVELSSGPPNNVRRTPAGEVVCSFPTEYGPFEVGYRPIEKRDVVTLLRMAQGPTDVYTHQSKGRRVADIRSSVIGETPGGLTSSLTSVVFSPPGDKPLSGMTIEEQLRAQGQVWRCVWTLRVAEYKSGLTVDQVDGLHLPIPDGTRALSIDPAYKSLVLAYRGGEVVRAVDGAPLDQVVAELGFRRRLINALWVVAAIGVVLIGVFVVRRRVRRRATA